MDKCKVENCDNKIKAKGYCQRHYSQLKNFNKIFTRTKFDKNEIILYKDYAEIILYNGENIEINRTQIDLEDVDKCINYKWSLNKLNYVCCKHNKTTIFLHRFLMDLSHENKETIDHIDRNKLNNRKSNLRYCNQSQNNTNTKIRKDNTSGFKGVYFNKEKQKWRAYIFINKKYKSLGYFDKLEDAVYIRNIFAQKQYKEFYFNGNEDK